MQTLPGHQGHRIWTVSWSVDGALPASGGADAAIWLWDAVTYECLQVLPVYQSDVTTVQFSPDGQ